MYHDHVISGAASTPGVLRTPLPAQMGSTPTMNMGRVDAATIQRAAAGLPSNVYNTLAQVAGQTPAQYGMPFGVSGLGSEEYYRYLEKLVVQCLLYGRF